MSALDDRVVFPVLDRVRGGTITVCHDEFRREWYHDGDRPCCFATYLLQVLVEQDYACWDSMIEQGGRLVARQDGAWAIKLTDKGNEWHRRLREDAARHDNYAAESAGGR
ncbi:MAG: hypothetical protein ACRDRR_08505 [Pseudonocardiaceae bacterium]